MGSLPTESLSVEEHQQQQVEMDDTSRTERARWLLNSPDPPSIWHELAGSIREAFFPRNKLSSSSRVKQTWRRSAFSFLRGLFPILNWGRNYKASKFKSDLMAGLTLASLSIPQVAESIGYANLAKLDPQYGLYTSVIPPLIYALMGSSREIAIGPVAVVSMLLSALMQNVQDPAADPVAYRKLVFTVTFFAGVFQSVFGLFRLGFLVDFLSHAAIVGFMAGAAIVIGLQQLKGLLGISHFTNKTDVVSVLGSVFSSLHHSLHNLTIPSLLCDFLAVLVSSEFRPRLFLPYLPLNCKEAIAVGRSFASIKGYHLDGNKEMVAMGFMNIAGSLTSCYVATGSFSRTAVNFSAGCQTVVSNIVMAITVLLSLELFTSLLYYTPIAILASIILSALPGLIDINEAINIYKVDKLDFLACIGAFLGVLFASVEIGLLAAVTISFAKILLNAVRPGIELQGRLPRTDTYGDISQFPMAIKTPGILTIRINSALFCFANANFIRERIMRWVTEEQDELEETTKRTIQAVIIDMSNLMNIDTSGILVLEELHKKLASNGIELVMASPRWQVIHKLKSAKLLDRIGKGCVYLSVAEAMEACLASKFAALSNC
ncbi:Sulfate transporter 2.1 [Citrus sinensis]|uniref:Sulfate transporter 2.1 n=1 Tax=Citrus sinensis TaxID=2711 RepID=A0ACB8KQL8_CITSI|nr:Sulfate transporter 2.1 [Citrus sinensis]